MTPVVPSFKQYLVEEEREAYFTFGRMNPPHIGHGKLMNVMSAKAGKTPYKVYLSQSQDARKNPLSFEQKIKYARKMFPKHARNVIMDKKIRTPMDVASKLYEQGYNKINMVVGEDRHAEFTTLLNRYNGQKGRHGFYNFEKINVISSGSRDPDGDAEEGMSATVQREAAKQNDFTKFSHGLPTNMSNKDAKKLFNDLRIGMGLKEVREFKNKVNFEPVSETREKYIEGELFNEGDEVRIRSGERGTIHRLGTNYVIVDLGEGVRRFWLDDVELVEDTMTDIRNFFDRHMNKKKYEKAVRLFLNMRKKNPGQSTKMLRKVGQMTGLDIREIDRVLRDMVKQGIMPKHLLNYPSIQRPVREENQPEWGTPESTKRAKKVTPGEVQEDEVKFARDQIAKELERDKEKFKDMVARARLARARRKNREADIKDRQESKGNPVAKNLNKFNRPATHKDKKKDAKRGYVKHKGQLNGGD